LAYTCCCAASCAPSCAVRCASCCRAVHFCRRLATRIQPAAFQRVDRCQRSLSRTSSRCCSCQCRSVSFQLFAESETNFKRDRAIRVEQPRLRRQLPWTLRHCSFSFFLARSKLLESDLHVTSHDGLANLATETKHQ
jgi:hypothetical protein